MKRIIRLFVYLFDPMMWLFVLWFLPLLIKVTFSDDIVTKLYQEHWLYAIGLGAGTLLVALKIAELLFDYFRKQLKFNAQFLLLALFGIMIMFYSFTYYQKMNILQQDLTIYKKHQTSEIKGKINIIHEPYFAARGGSDYLYTLKVGKKELLLYRKTALTIDKDKTYQVNYLPNTKQIVSMKKLAD